MSSPERYKKFSGRSTFSVQTAYLGRDHLLILDGSYAETRRKLAFEDIEAVLIAPSRGSNVAGLLCGLAAFGSFIGILANFSEGGGVPLWIVLFVFFGGVAAMLIYGQGSALFGVKTAVQTVVLHGINTRRKANRAMEELTTLIESKQGKLTYEALEPLRSSNDSSLGSTLKLDSVKAGAPPPILPPSGSESGSAATNTSTEDVVE